MFGWFISARALRSASNRASTALESMPGLITFKATLRRSGFSCSADVDDSHATLADQLAELVRANGRTEQPGIER